jgi:3-oxoacyl-[acyl-carrier protein] reductase
MTDPDFGGRLIVITGAAGVYGRQFAERFAQLGAHLFLTDRDEQGLADARERLPPNARAETLAADLVEAADLARLCDAVIARFGAPDVVINNAGVYPFGGLFDTSLETFDRIFDVNVRAGFEITRRLARAMIDAGRKGRSSSSARPPRTSCAATASCIAPRSARSNGS